MASSVLAGPPDRIQRQDVTVMEQTTVDDLPHIELIWPSFEELVGLRGRKMYARVDTGLDTYTVCTPVRGEDRPDDYGLQVGTLAGGWYLRGRLVGEPPEVYEGIAAGMQELLAAMERDDSRPLVEFYRRHDEIELWLPITAGVA